MSKGLTEQWKNGELEGGHYYLLMKDGSTRIANTVYVVAEKQFYWENTSIDFIQEVLAPVPSYDEIKEMSQKIERLEFDNEALEMAHNEGKEINAELVSKTDELEKKLKIATKALKNAHKFPSTMSLKEYCEQALKEMEGIK